MQIKPITNSKQWLDTIYRGARAKRKDGQQVAERLVFLFLRTQYSHNWLQTVQTRGRKNKGNRLYVMAADYFYSLNGPDRVKLVEDCFEVNWSSRRLRAVYQSMLDDEDSIRY